MESIKAKTAETTIDKIMRYITNTFSRIWEKDLWKRFLQLVSLLLVGCLLYFIYRMLFTGGNTDIDSLLKIVGAAFIVVLLPDIKRLFERISGFKIKDLEISLDKIAADIVNKSLIAKVRDFINNGSSDNLPDDLIKEISNAQKNIVVGVFNAVIEYRESITYQIMGCKDVGMIINRKTKLNKLLPILKLLISVFEKMILDNDTTLKLHKCHAQLAYVLKDSYWEKQEDRKENYKEAYAHIDKAIEIRDKAKHTATHYEFNRLILCINLEEEEYKKYLEKDYQAVYGDRESRYMLFETDENIAPYLEGWISQNKSNDKEKWENDHKGMPGYERCSTLPPK